MAPWWRGATLYHVYVRSFLDTDGDGQGDLAGVVRKLDYIRDLGVDGVWLSPIHPSPNRDWGYDIADYGDVAADYGGMAAFETLLEGAHARGLKVLLDEVLAHTSDEHPWFVESLSGGETGDKADWYVWAEPRADGTAPNNWLSVFGGPAWAYQPGRRKHYHHKFLRQQPKLNWLNPAAREAALGVLDFWLAKGVDGFRLDVANAFLHDADLRDNPPAVRDEAYWRDAAYMQRHLFDSNLPENLPLLDLVRRRVDGFEDRFVFGEFSEEEARCGGYASPDEGLHSAYTFVLLKAGSDLPQVLSSHLATLAAHPDHWPTISFSNHDLPRVVSRIGGGDETPELAKALFALLVGLRGTTLVYQGEELGLPQARLPRDRQRDPVGDLYWPYTFGRDGCRTPMPWTEDPTMGFTDGEPWLPLATEHEGLSVEAQEADPDSPLAFAREAIALKRMSQALRFGDLEAVDAPAPLVAFLRSHGEETVMVVANLGTAPAVLEHPRLNGAGIILATDGGDLRGASLGLAPQSAAFLKTV